MPTLIYLNGEFHTADDARVSLFDRGYLLGDSIFETVRVYRGTAFRLAARLDRLERGSRATGIKLPLPRDKLVARVEETIRRSEEMQAVVRITVSRGEGPPGIGTVGCDRPLLSIWVRPLTPYPAEAYRQGIKTMVVETRCIPPACRPSDIKCGNYLPNVLARRELQAQGMIEGVQLSVDGCVVGGTVANVFLVERGRLITPDLRSGCLPGITRAAVLELAAELSIQVKQCRVELEQLDAADEVFFTNSVMEILPVAQIGERRFDAAPGPVTRRVQEAFVQLVQRETYWGLHCSRNEGDQREPGSRGQNVTKCSTINRGINKP